MGMSECNVTILQVADLLQAKYACISGGKSRRNHTILSFPECPTYPTISDQQFNTLLTYLSSILSAEEVELGVVVVVDRREDKWSSIKTLLLQISTLVTVEVQKVYVLRPVGFLQRTLADTTLKFLAPEFKLKVLLLDSCEQLHDYIDLDQLTDDFNGILPFNHAQWIQHRAALEKFSSNVFHLNKTLRTFCQELEDGEFPNDVAQTEELMKEHEGVRTEIKESIESTVNHGCVLLECIYGGGEGDGGDADSGIAVSNSDDSVASNNSVTYPIDVANYLNGCRRGSVGGVGIVGGVSRGIISGVGGFGGRSSVSGVSGVSRSNSVFNNSGGNEGGGYGGRERRSSECMGGVVLMEQTRAVSKGKQMHLKAVARLLSELEETSAKFDLFWQHHTGKLDQCLQLRRFEEDFKQLQIATTKHITKCTNIHLTCNTTDQLTQATNHLNSFELESKDDLRRASLLRFRGQKFIEANHYALDCIKPKCSELERMVEVYDTFLKESMNVIRRAKLFYERIEMVSTWVIKVEDYLVENAYPGVSPEQLQVINSHLSHLDEDFNNLDFKDSNSFQEEYKDFLTPEMNASAVLKQYENAIRNLKQHKNTIGEEIKRNQVMHDNCAKDNLTKQNTKISNINTNEFNTKNNINMNKSLLNMNTNLNSLTKSQNYNESPPKLITSIFQLHNKRKTSLQTENIFTIGQTPPSSSNCASTGFSIYNDSFSSHINPFANAVNAKNRNLSGNDNATEQEINDKNNNNLSNNKLINDNNNNSDKPNIFNFTKKYINKNKNKDSNKDTNNNINNNNKEENKNSKSLNRSFSLFSSSMKNLHGSKKKAGIQSNNEDVDFNNNNNNSKDADNEDDIINNNYNIINDFKNTNISESALNHGDNKNTLNNNTNQIVSFSNNPKTNNYTINSSNNYNTPNNNPNNNTNNNISHHNSIYNLDHSSLNTMSISNINSRPREKENKVKKKFSFAKKKGLERKFSKSISNLGGVKKIEVDEKRKREVVNSLFEAEKSYLEVLKLVKENYIERFESLGVDGGVDGGLDEDILSQERNIFANWKLIYYFHTRIFSRELKRVESSAYADTLVSCFSVNEDEISQLYAEYFRKRTVSHLLIERISMSPFIKECEKDSESKESLDLMLTRPLQQLHIYNGLLKELSEITKLPYHEVTERILTKAFDYVPVRGFDGDLKTGGRLILQGDMHVVLEEGRTGGLKMRLSLLSSLRHVFFYEKFLLLSKKKEVNERNSFDFKSLLPMAEITLTENVKNDKKKFQLCVQGTDQVYIFQADSVNERDVWVSEIKKVLMTQFESIKEERKMKPLPFAQRQLELTQEEDSMNLETTIPRNDFGVTMVTAN